MAGFWVSVSAFIYSVTRRRIVFSCLQKNFGAGFQKQKTKKKIRIRRKNNPTNTGGHC